MLRKLLTENLHTEQTPFAKEIFLSLKAIQQKLEDEMESKQAVINGSWSEIRMLRETLQQKDQHIAQLEKSMGECQRTAEGNRQIINKLLNDLDRMQQDIEWYKRTYESRSLLGTIKEKLFGRGINRKK